MKSNSIVLLSIITLIYLIGCGHPKIKRITFKTYQANQRIIEGNELLRQNRLDNALKLYQRAVYIDPESAIAYFWMGQIYFRKSQYDDAIVFFSKSIQANPKVASFYINKSSSEKKHGGNSSILNHNKAISYFSRGVSHVKNNNLESAVSDFNMAIQLDPGVAYYYLARGRLNVDKGDYSEALNDLNTSIKLDPSEAHKYHSLRGQVFEKLSKYDEALAEYYKAIKKEPEYIGLHKRFIIPLVKKGDYNKAHEMLTKSLHNDFMDTIFFLKNIPLKFNKVYLQTYYAYRKSMAGDHIVALRMCDENSAILPEFFLPYALKATILRKMGKAAGADFNYKKAVDLYAQSGEKDMFNNGLFNIGENDLQKKIVFIENNLLECNDLYNDGKQMMDIGDYGAATVFFRQACEICPERYLFFNDLGHSLIKQGQFQEAIIPLFKGLDLIKDYSVLYANLGDAYSLSGNFYAAQKFFNKSIEILSVNNRAYGGRAYLYHMRGEYRKAIEDYTIAIKREPNNTALYINRADTLIKINKFDLALRDYNKVIELDPMNSKPYQLKGELNLELNDLHEALKDFSMVVKLQSNKALVYINRGSVYHRSGDIEKACEDFSTACELGDCSGVNFMERKSLCEQ